MKMCKLGFHKWGDWKYTHSPFAIEEQPENKVKITYNPFVILHERTCKDCGKVGKRKRKSIADC